MFTAELKMKSVLAYKSRLSADLLVSDEDSADFLQSQFTNDLRPFEAGGVTYGLWLNVKGKVLADSFVLCLEPEAFRVLSFESSEAAIRQTMQEHIIADDVEIEQMGSSFVISVIGDEAAEVLGALGLDAPEAGKFFESEGCIIFRGRRSRKAAFELIFDSAALADQTWEKLISFGVTEASPEVIEGERVAASIPAVPREVGPGDLPGEGGLQADAVSFTKGCYLGQEVVARMEHVGRPQRGLFIVEGKCALPSSGVDLTNSEGKKIGELRSVIETHHGKWTGVAMLKIRFSGPGDEIVVGAQTCRISHSLR